MGTPTNRAVMRHRLSGAVPFWVRSLKPSDATALLPIKNDPEIGRLVGATSRTYTPAEMDDWVKRHRQATDEAFFVIADATDTAVGHVALYEIDPVNRSAELGILLGAKQVWGQGVGTRATRFIVEHGFDELGLRRIYLEVLDTNARARSIYEKLGFVVEGRLRQHQLKNGAFIDVIVMGLFPHEYQRADG
jgi:RimJ/RimL family protein N-acetyltransferase